MKKILMVLLISTILISSCADKKTIDGVTYRPYGIINEETCKNDSIQYQVSGWAVASGIIFCEMIVPPIYVFGYNLWEPVGKKTEFKQNINKGVVK